MAAHDENVVWHPHPVTVAQREQLHGHRGVVLWFTGLSGSGKSTVAGRWKRHYISRVSVLTCSMVTMCVTACVAIWGLAMKTAKRTFAGSGKSPA
jgi:ABC-type proline/glycine betaine transport system ATPase subunit